MRSLLFAGSILVALLPALPAAAQPPPSSLPPRTLPWSPGDPVPPNYRPVTKPRLGFLIASACVGTTFYALTALASADDMHRGKAPALIPVVGPFIAMKTFRPSDEVPVFQTMMGIFGVGQVIGIGLLAVGLAWPQHELQLTPRQTVTLELSPTGPAGGGISVRF